MKSKKGSKKDFRHSDIERNDIESQRGKGAKRDKGSKRRLSIYDDFDDEALDENVDLDNSDDFYED